MSKQNGNNPAVQLKKLKHRENMVHDYRAVIDELNPVTETWGGGLTLLRIEEENQVTLDVISKVLLNDDKIAETLWEFNTKHYGQANYTVFGGGNYYRLLTDRPMANPV